jgi:hypothetical protein
MNCRLILTAEVSAGRMVDYTTNPYRSQPFMTAPVFTRLASHTSCMAGHLSLVEENEDLFEFFKLI